MPALLIVFQDGELLHADTEVLSFDLPVLDVEVLSVDSNSERAIIPLAGIRQILVGEVEPAPPQPQLEGWDRAAFHFLDGQVMRAFVDPDVLLGAHGGIWRVVEPGHTELRRLAIPYSSLKGVFRLHQWDGRSATARRAATEAGRLEHMVSVFAEREARSSQPRGGGGNRGQMARLRPGTPSRDAPAAKRE